ncbi:MAG: epimerase, partial [Acidobacteria bacterium]
MILNVILFGPTGMVGQSVLLEARAARSRIRAQRMERGVVGADSVVSGAQESVLDRA